MKSFKDFGIKAEHHAFKGEKIKIDRLLNVEIIVYAHKIEPSKQKPGTNLLTLQIELNGERRVVFTGATILQQQIKQIPQEDYPFTTTIIKNADALEFT